MFIQPCSANFLRLHILNVNGASAQQTRAHEHAPPTVLNAFM